MKKYLQTTALPAIQFMGTPESANEVFDTFDIPGAKFVPGQSLEVGEISIPIGTGVVMAKKGYFIFKEVDGSFFVKPSDVVGKSYKIIDG